MKTREEKIKELASDIYDLEGVERIVKAEKAIRRQVVIDMVLNKDITVTECSKNNTISIPKFRARIATYIPYPNIESLYEDLIRYGIYNLKCQPYQKYINNGVFVYSPITTTFNSITADVPNWMITSKGQEYILRFLIYRDEYGIDNPIGGVDDWVEKRIREVI